MFAYAYAVGALTFAVIWIILYTFLPRCRGAILLTSLVFAPAGPISEYWHLKDYWHPSYLVTLTIRNWSFGFEDYLVAFAFAGISAGIFEGFALREGFKTLPGISLKTFARMELWLIIAFTLFFLLDSAPGMTSVPALISAGMITASIMLFRKWDVLLLIIPIAALLGLLFWFFYVGFFIPLFPGVIQELWSLHTTMGVMLLGVPIEEPLWALSIGLFAGPAYRIASQIGSGQAKYGPISDAIFRK